MNALILLALTSVLVLRSGDRIVVEGTAREENGVVVFRSAGKLYSLPAAEVDAEATRAEAERATEPKSEPVRRLRVSEEQRRRLITELEQNHGGTPPAQPTPVLLPPDEPAHSGDEWEWRNRARAYEESVLQAKEELQLLEAKVEQLRNEIHAFVSLGYKPRQFTWQSSQLEYALARIPRAKLEITRAERALVQFKEDARKQGVMPGWLR
jgi:hypothetical protein